MKKRVHSHQRGQTLVEFALILPAFLLLAVVIFDFGRAVYYYSTIHNAAREGARYGIVHPNDTDGIKAAVVNYAIGLGITQDNVPDPIISLSEQVGGNKTYAVTVTVNYCFVPVTPLVVDFLPAQTDAPCGCNKHLLLSSEAVMRTETKPDP
jgi:Flp pilus assembly protein TadG